MARIRTLVTVLILIIVPSLFIYCRYYDSIQSTLPMHKQPSSSSSSENIIYSPVSTNSFQSAVIPRNGLTDSDLSSQPHKYAAVWRHLQDHNNTFPSQQHLTSSPSLNNNFHQQNLSQNTKNTIEFRYVEITPPRIPPPNETMDPAVENKRQVIKQMMKEAWDGYVQYAWGYNELQPLTRDGKIDSIFGANKLGLTIVDSMDTLYLMDMKEEFKKGKQWIADELDFKNVQTEISLFETIIRYVGGLLTCFAFTGDPMFLYKARDIAQTLLPAYDTPTGIPNGLIIPKTGKSYEHSWAYGSILSEFGSQHLEYTYLSDMTQDKRFSDRAQQIRSVLKKIEKPNGIYSLMFDNVNGAWADHKASLGALGDSFYEYLIKSYVQSGHRDKTAMKMYLEAMDAIDRSGMINQSKSGRLTYIADLIFGKPNNKMQHLTCFAGGMYILGVHHMDEDLRKIIHDDSNSSANQNIERRRNRHFALAVNITETCHQSYHRTPTHLGPESFYFDDQYEAINRNGDYYILRPEVIESFFIMWRMTHDQRYRDYAWEATQAILKHCRTGHGFTGIYNVMKPPPATKDNTQQSFFLAETLKYLYLIFSNDKLLPLDEWVFNTEAHPLPVCGKNPSYPLETCNRNYE